MDGQKRPVSECLEIGLDPNLNLGLTKTYVNISSGLPGPPLSTNSFATPQPIFFKQAFTKAKISTRLRLEMRLLPTTTSWSIIWAPTFLISWRFDFNPAISRPANTWEGDQHLSRITDGGNRLAALDKILGKPDGILIHQLNRVDHFY